MTYSEATDWLFNQLPMYQKMGKKAYKADLSNTIKLATYLNNPEDKFKSVHVAGTNGKGSTSHMLASVLQEAGYKVGLYTSPHLKDFRERIKINGKLISEAFVVSFVSKHQRYFKENQLSFFEMTVGMAFDYFAKQKVDIAIIEVGLGGRLDSTNIITPEVSVITNIGLDHTQFLGNTLAKIAYEKAGIIKRKRPCIIGTSTSETKIVFEQLAKERGSNLYYAEQGEPCPYETDLLGSYQKENSKTALTTLGVLQSLSWSVGKEAITNGFKNVVKNTGLQGRWQQLNANPLTICDTAHNKEGLSYVIPQLLKQNYKKLHIVLGFVADKNIEEILPLFPKKAIYYFTKPENSRALSEVVLQKTALKHGLIGDCFLSVNSAYDSAKKYAKKEDVIYIGGSTFVVAEIL